MKVPRVALACLLSLTLLCAGIGAAHAAAPVLLLDATPLDASQRQLAASLQGIANRAPEGPQVFLLTRPSDEAWLAYSLRLTSRATEAVTLDELLARVKPRLQGQVLYDPARPFTLDVATLAAGIRDAALTDKDLGLTTVYDFRTRWKSAEEAYQWAAGTLLTQGNRKQVALISSESSAMRDYAVQQKMLTVSPTSGLSMEAWQDLLSHFNSGTVLFGEYVDALLPVTSTLSDYLMPAAQTANLSYYGTAGADTRFYQYPGHLEPVAPRYLTLILDCSDLDTAVNRMPELWESGARGSIPLGWAIPGTLATAAPSVTRRYYSEAYRSGMDQFVLGASGAGFMDVARASSPDAFYHATAKAADALDAHTGLYQAPDSPDAFADAVLRLADEGGISGVFLLTSFDQPPAIYRNQIPALVTPYINSVEQGVTYLNRIPLDRRFAALCLNAATMTPEDAAHLAAHVSSRYLLVPPAELMALMLSVGRGQSADKAAVQVVSAEFPEGTIAPDATVPIHVGIQPADQVFSAEVVYRPAGSRIAFSRPLQPSGNAFRAELPPLRWGGDQELKVRVVDTQGRVAWSPLWAIKVARSDADGDGLSDAEEAYLLSDPQQADTDKDGLLDANDPHPLTFDRVPVTYFGPIGAPGDLPYLTNPGDVPAEDAGRIIAPGKSANYWLPFQSVPTGGAAVVSLQANGSAEIALGADPRALTSRFTGDVKQTWESDPLELVTYRNGVYLRVTCPAQATAPLTLSSLAVTSPSKAPSLVLVQRSPVAPGPGQPVVVSTRTFSPDTVAEVGVTYRVNGDGTATVPMAEQGHSQGYAATLPADFNNRDVLEYWVTAKDKNGASTWSRPQTVVIGGRGREIVALRARQNFLGAWRPSPEWEGEASYAPEAGAQDTAPVNLTGGTYTVWVLAAGRGSGLSVSVEDRRVGAIDPNRPDGWQQVGRVKLEAGKHHVTLTAEAASPDAPWTAPRYAAVILSTDTTFEPPVDQMFDVLNSLVLLSPAVDSPLTGIVELRATGAGNLLAVEISLDGTLLRRVTGPPFTFSLSTSRYENGQHTLRLEAVDRTGPTGLVLETPITIAN